MEAGEYTDFNGVKWVIIIDSTFYTTKPEGTYPWVVKNPAKVKWKGDEDTYSSIRASQCSFSFYAQDQTELDDMVDIAEDANSPYVMVFKGSSLYWWGYLNTDNFKWKNEYFPTEVAFEADDLLSMSQKRFFWKETHGKTELCFN